MYNGKNNYSVMRRKKPLNKRSELLGKCRHRAKYLLAATIKKPNQKLPTGQG